MGGTVGMRSALGRGSTFWIELPLEPQPEPQGDAAERLSGGVVVVGGRDMAVTLAERMQRFGVETRCVATAESAAELLRHGQQRQAVLVTRREPPVDLAALGRLVLLNQAVEPIDLITVGVARVDAFAPTLADLPLEVADRQLHAALRAALRTTPATGEDLTAGSAVTAVEPGRSLHVLVAEDNRTNQRVIRKLLEHAGHRVTMVATGQEAVEALEEPAFDLVLMDLNMPELGGIEAVKLLRFTHDSDDLPPIVALSADATPQTREECRSVGFSAYLTKPIDSQSPAPDDGGADRHRAAMPGRDAGQQAALPTTRHRQAQWPAAPLPTPVDLRRLGSLAELDSGDGFLDGLIDDFVADLETIVLQLEEAAAKGDARTFRNQAHALRSSAAHVGAVGAVRPLPELARAGRSRPAAAGWRRACPAAQRGPPRRRGAARVQGRVAAGAAQGADVRGPTRPGLALQATPGSGAAPGGGPGNPSGAVRPR